jgi:hypothetical protein
MSWLDVCFDFLNVDMIEFDVLYLACGSLSWNPRSYLQSIVKGNFNCHQCAREEF